MKTIKKNILTMIFIFYYLFSHSQQAHYSASRELKFHQNSIKNTAYIFEGIVTKQQCYYGKNKEILTCSIISITKIFKGNPQIKLGVIKVITKQAGHIGSNNSKKVLDDKGVALGKGTTYIIFGREAYSYMLSDTLLTTDNSIIITTMDCDSPITFLGNVAQWGYTSYKTLNELYAFFKENGLTVQEEVEQKK